MNLLCRCPKEVYPHVTTIINICLKYLTYDPNYNYDDEDEDENAMDADGGDDDDQGNSCIDSQLFKYLRLRQENELVSAIKCIFKMCLDLVWKSPSL